MDKKLKKIPDFKTEDEEREFWSTHSSVDYIDWSKAKIGVFPNLKLTSKPISIRLTTSMVYRLKEKANSIAVPYQALIKQYIADGLEKHTDAVYEKPKYQYGKVTKARSK